MVLGLAACATKTEPAQPEETTPGRDDRYPGHRRAHLLRPRRRARCDRSNRSVYYLNFKPEADAVSQKLATYTEQTGRSCQGRHRCFRHL